MIKIKLRTNILGVSTLIFPDDSLHNKNILKLYETVWTLTFLPLPDCRKGVGTKGLVNGKCEGTRSRDLCKVPRWVGPREGEAEGQLVPQGHGSCSGNGRSREKRRHP